MKKSFTVLSGALFLTTCMVVYAQAATTQFRPLAAASKRFSRAVAACRAAEGNPVVRKPIKTKVKIRPLDIPALVYNPVNEVVRLNENRITKELIYGAYMLENLRGKDVQGNLAPLYPSQDRLFVGDLFGKTMFALCDGHGQNGSKIAEQVIKTIPLQVLNRTDVQDGLRKACKAMQEKFQKSPHAQHSGATFVAGVIQNKLLTVANLGDSRLLVVRPSQGIIPFVTRDHKATLYEYTHRGLALTRTLGDIEICNKWGLSSCPDVTQVKLAEGDYIVIASDGYWDVVTNEETRMFITDTLRTRVACSCKDMAEQLTKKARDRDSRDDISVLVVRYGIAIPDTVATVAPAA